MQRSGPLGLWYCTRRRRSLLLCSYGVWLLNQTAVMLGSTDPIGPDLFRFTTQLPAQWRLWKAKENSISSLCYFCLLRIISPARTKTEAYSCRLLETHFHLDAEGGQQNLPANPTLFCIEPTPPPHGDRSERLVASWVISYLAQNGLIPSTAVISSSRTAAEYSCRWISSCPRGPEETGLEAQNTQERAPCICFFCPILCVVAGGHYLVTSLQGQECR